MKRAAITMLELLGVAFALAMLVGSIEARAQADERAYVFRTDHGSNGKPMVLKLYTAPCTHPKILDLVLVAYRPYLRASMLTWDGKDWESCWLLNNGRVQSVDSEGVMLNAPDGLPVGLFRREEGI